ncbi:glucose regulated protein 94, putative [Trypanosoma brucei gambiense DAL972]|uniref:Lipophosphoglycan biosynthetic protein, putative n=1 Tax=Trypanosoma brucei gambiense (strain MHOM/CI/86/DAL972) TaxID=679716 RepID=C9ZL35_TRYB9|nr:glucose regulated protein 94, putative [Trypanosoma brucei gambiense DAL972]CBH10044.1 glucose regulated protein 94, putative [Trypanosoma brucei gambiense DAL972]|eukprot:XP_011772334.1 glucose regulated protein 94, putative [Trypanosoma brucei gambiense DAL972]
MIQSGMFFALRVLFVVFVMLTSAPVEIALGDDSELKSNATFSKGKSIPFQAEVSKMLDILIHSLYTNRAVFLRELISNGSDALDKIRMLYLTTPKEPVNKDGEAPTMDIRLSVDPEQKTLTLRDGGVGMTRQELEANLGSLGSSGTKRFMEKLQETKDSNLIGQFGVGFYSAFLVAERVRVASKSDDDEKQWVWESAADGQYYVYEDERGNTLGRGTEITLELKPDALDFLSPETVRNTVRQYSEFVHFPIRMKRGEEWDVLNENQPIWTRKPSNVSKEEYEKFYMALSRDYRPPMYYSHFNVEGEVEFSSVLFVPQEVAQENFINNENTRDNIKLYVRRIFITDEFRELLPRYLNFVKGVVDSNDLPLNVSREVLQESRILRVIKKKLVRKVLSMFAEIAANDARMKEQGNVSEEVNAEVNTTNSTSGSKKKGPLYPKFWAQFGKHLRLGILEDANNRGRLAKLLRYVSSKSNGTLVSFQEYIDRMQPNQKGIYYMTGDSVEKMMQSPHMEEPKMRGVEVLLMTDAIDEYVVGQVHDFANKKLINIATDSAQLDDVTDKQKAIEKKRNEKFRPLTDALTRVFKGNRVRKVILTKRKTSEPFILSSQENEMSPRLANIIKQQAVSSDHSVFHTLVLEINYRHPVVQQLLARFQANANDQVALDIAWVLFGTASLQADSPVPDQAKTQSA